MVLSELGADLLFTQIKIEGRKSSFVNLSREHASDLDNHPKTDWRNVPLSAVLKYAKVLGCGNSLGKRPCIV